MPISTYALITQVQSADRETIRGPSEENVCFKWVVNRNQEIIAAHNLDWTCTEYFGLLHPEDFKTVASIIDRYNVLNVKYSISFTIQIEQDPKNKR